jgi:hypothetical protein
MDTKPSKSELEKKKEYQSSSSIYIKREQQHKTYPGAYICRPPEYIISRFIFPGNL